MKSRASLVLLAWLGLVCVPTLHLFAQCYSFSASTGRRITGSFNDLGFTHRTGAWGSNATRLIDIGFTFRFNEVAYTQLTVYNNGVVVMGNNTLSSSNYNQLQSGSNVIAPFWDDLRVTDNLQWQGTGCSPSSVRYMLTGAAPNRILVIDWDQLGLGQGGYGMRAATTFQLRLYEVGSQIEFYYEKADGLNDRCSQWGSSGISSSASIGLGYAGGFTSVTPQGGSTAISSTGSSNDYVDVYSTPIAQGTIYTFSAGGVTGNIAEGGTAAMATGDTLLVGKKVVLSNAQNFLPFTLISPCASTVSYTITGPSASEYTVTPASGPLSAAGSTPTIRFSPTGIGRRYATLTASAGTSMQRVYVLAAEGTPRTKWVGNLPQGGTAAMKDGDTLMQNIGVYNGSSGSFSPFTIQVPAGGNIPALMTYTLTDPSGQFRISPASQSVMPGANATPVITFAPTGIGWQYATLRVNAEGEIRTFLLRAFARGAGAIITIGDQLVKAGLPVFRNSYGCVGIEAGAQTTEIRVENIGDEPFLFQTEKAYQTETAIRQGTPPFNLLRDPSGKLVPVSDYFLSATSGSGVPVPLPLAIPPGATQTVYLSFVPTRPGKRFAKAYFQTNGLNFSGVDSGNVATRGMLNFELVGNGLGALLTNKEGTKLPNAVTFVPTDVRATSKLTGYIRNSGECDMFIPSADFRLVSGDIDEFKIVTPLHSAKDALGNHILAPGQIDSFEVSFTPTRSGSRRASIRVRSNDSSLITSGVAELGVYYLDIFGIGKVGLESRLVTLPPAVIGGPGSVGHATVENTSGEVVEITNITMVGGNGEIIEDPANRWPALPLKINPGTTLDLGLAFNVPAGGTPGKKTARIEVRLSGGTVLTIDVEGLAGTRQLLVAPTSLFQGVKINAGELRRQFVAVTNTGTFPVTVQELKLTEANPGDYKVSPLIRNVMEPGQIEFYEVTYSPQATGVSSGTLEILGNFTNGPQNVTLGGEASSTAPVGGASGSTIAVTGEGDVAVRPGVSYSGWSASMANGTLLWQSMPNPTGAQAEIRYYLPQDGEVQVTLYTSSGRQVREVMNGVQERGEHHVMVDVRNLASGRYYYTLRTKGGALTLALDVVK